MFRSKTIFTFLVLVALAIAMFFAWQHWLKPIFRNIQDLGGPDG